MLSELHIKNIAVIEEASIEFEPGLNVLTGETGAGKSIVIDALGAVIGTRVGRDMLRTGSDKGSVTAVFRSLEASRWLEENDIDIDDDDIIIQRKITSDGKNTCRVCGQPITVTQLKELGTYLLDIHGQNDGRLLMDESNHLGYLDSFGDYKDLLDQFHSEYHTCTEIYQKMKRLSMDEAERQQMYTIARDECASIINSGKNTLPASFETNFKALCKEDVTAGNESLFEIPFSAGRGRVCWTYGVKHGDKDQWTQLASGGKVGPTPTLWYDFDAKDARRNITCIPYQWKGGVKTISNLSGGGWSFGKLRYEWMSRVVTSSNDDGLNWQVMRYADIYMMAAEAENQLNGPANAVQYIQPVMNRAYGTTLASSKIAAASTKDAFQQLVEDERKFEFAGEGLRKVDLMRWGKLSEKLAETKQKMTDLANRAGAYANYPKKVYYNDGLDADANDADGYTLYGLEEGQTDADGKAVYANNSNAFYLTGDASSDNDQKVTKYINNLYLNDPNSKMFWPIWRTFILGSNGMLVNDYGYGE